MNIQEVIEQHGPQIVENLKIASEMLYDKVLWYVRIKGVIGVSQTILDIIFFIVFNLISFKIIDKFNSESDYPDRDVVLFLKFISFFMSFIALMLFELVIGSLVKNISMIVVPEFYIIDSIINKVN